MLLNEVVIISLEGNIQDFGLIEFFFQSDNIGIEIIIAFVQQVINQPEGIGAAGFGFVIVGGGL